MTLLEGVMMNTEQQRNSKPMIALLMMAAFVGLFGETAMNMAMTDVMRDFGISATSAQWLTTGNPLSFTRKLLSF